jgi:transposase
MPTCSGVAVVRGGSSRAHRRSDTVAATTIAAAPPLPAFSRRQFALNVLDGTIICRNMKRHRHQEFIRFLNAVDAQVPRRKDIHAIIDNYATHKHPKVREWLSQHPRWTFHFTPTSASWLNAVEGFFATLTKKRLKRGVFRSVDGLKLWPRIGQMPLAPEVACASR